MEEKYSWEKQKVIDAEVSEIGSSDKRRDKKDFSFEHATDNVRTRTHDLFKKNIDKVSVAGSRADKDKLSEMVQNGRDQLKKYGKVPDTPIKNKDKTPLKGFFDDKLF